VFAQLVVDLLGVSSSRVEIGHGDTARSPFGLGTYGSRSAAVGGAAIAKAVGKIIDKGAGTGSLIPLPSGGKSSANSNGFGVSDPSE
jgi:CO/xanthine dehydrogenase Mo-binding subunit